MSDAPENITLVYLRRFDERQARMESDIREIKDRLGILETQTAGLGNQYASLSRRLDTLDERLARIERRLDLVASAT
jgi:predicted  nucleic acid-binding Zn-ribbon protein